MSAEDLRNIAVAAYDDKWYDSAIKFFRAAFDILEKNETVYKDDWIENMKVLAKESVKIHNALLDKRRYRVGPGKM